MGKPTAAKGSWLPALEGALALGALEASGPAAPSTLEWALAGAALRAVRRMGPGTLRMALAVLARSRPLATWAIALTIGRTRPIVAALLSMDGPLVVAAPVGAIGTGWLDRDARSRGPGVAMTAITATSAEAAAAVPAALLALRSWQLQSLESLGSSNEALGKRGLGQLLASQSLDVAQVDALVGGAECDRGAIRAGARGAADTVDILLGNVG